MFEAQARVRVSRARPSHCSVSVGVIGVRDPEAGALELQLPVRVTEWLDALIRAAVALAQVASAHPRRHLAGPNQLSNGSVVQVSCRRLASNSFRQPVLGQHARAAALHVARPLVACRDGLLVLEVPIRQLYRAVVRNGDCPVLKTAECPANRHKPLTANKLQIRQHVGAQLDSRRVPRSFFKLRPVQKNTGRQQKYSDGGIMPLSRSSYAS